MPAHPQPAAMTSDEFREILEAAGLSTNEATKLLGVGKSTISRWLNNETPISVEKAVLIRARIKRKK